MVSKETRAKISAAQKKRWAAKRTKPVGQTVLREDLQQKENERARAMVEALYDPVQHPVHYTKHPSGIECITITEHMNFNLGNAMKYLWRAGEKGDYVEQLKKAKWHIEREINRVGSKG
jgi:hypothetical protein